MNHRFCVCLLLACWTFASFSPVRAQDEASEPGTEEGRVVQFQRDIAPLFATRCLECHDEKESKGGFRIDDAAAVADYLEPGEGAASTLMTDYLQTADTDMMMPPASHGGPLSPAELSLIRVWIDEGAQWPEGAAVMPVGVAGGTAPEATEATKPEAPRSLVGRVWAFQGYFHPALVHFPIALLTIGGLFVVISWFHPALGNHVALSCLFLGSVSAVVASAMGWAFASEQGYGSGTTIDFDSTAFWHRWSGIVVSVIAVLTSVIAIRSLSGRSLRLRVLWKSGLLLCAALVGLVGHQGGELTYGEAHYQRAFDILLPGTVGDESPAAPVETTPEETAPGEPAMEEPAAADPAATKPADVEPDASTSETPSPSDKPAAEPSDRVEPTEPSAEPAVTEPFSPPV